MFTVKAGNLKIKVQQFGKGSSLFELPLNPQDLSLLNRGYSLLNSLLNWDYIGTMV